MTGNWETVGENRWFRLVLADVLMPDGRHLDHYAIRMGPAAVNGFPGA